MSDLLDLITPGEILKEEFMDPHAISANRLARDIDVPANRISEIVAGRRAITADTALRLGAYFGMEPRFWLNLQSDYDLRAAQRASGAEIADRVRPLNAA
ncbi:HigA family addiction module antitoxin [Arenibaculum sp.]|jgi:addiction module HigA family antidote|uniref:HigA family addiction module antitoxin n=1 Tax=Arenibaculum sp. TaxID=2865862 RepID=UPI002E1253D6|nr:HigA family addiction module antitoxin [Arenibaculum sp.]